MEGNGMNAQMQTVSGIIMKVIMTTTMMTATADDPETTMTMTATADDPETTMTVTAEVPEVPETMVTATAEVTEVPDAAINNI
jgi:hypothetical protein